MYTTAILSNRHKLATAQSDADEQAAAGEIDRAQAAMLAVLAAASSATAAVSLQEQAQALNGAVGRFRLVG